MPVRPCHRLNRIEIAPGDNPYAGSPVRKADGEAVVEVGAPWLEGSLRARRVGAGRIMHWGGERVGAELVYHGRRDGADRGLYFIFARRGGWRDTFRGKGRGACERGAGQMSVLRAQGLRRHHCFPCTDAWHLCIEVGPASLADWIEGDGEALRRLQRLRRGEGPPHLTLPTTAFVRLALERIEKCPQRGGLRALAMEARCNDLLLAFVEALDGGAPRRDRMDKGDADRIHAAAGILAARLEEPPSLAELARTVGLNESYLTRGFRKVFGAAPFGWLRERRMERARELLESGRASVLEAALFVGHRNPGHFARLFVQRFGVSPKEVKRRGGT